MAEANMGCEANGTFKEAVCLDAGRVFDSCCDRDCLEDLRVYFSETGQGVINEAVSVKIRSAEAVYALIDVEPVNLNKGCYSCDITFFFLITLDAYSAGSSCPTEVRGLSLYNKKAVLFGGEGNVRTFSSDNPTENCPDICGRRLSASPRCVVQAVDPIALSSRLGVVAPVFDNIALIPECITEYVGGEVITDLSEGSPAVYATLGLFTIVQLIRNVQVLVPVYDYCIPEKQCDCNVAEPCDVFRKIQFPTEDFFPTKNGNCCY
ncbi:MAG: hypothetical protein IIW94_00880 [Clostridia bacterium]|nr:hypothetical protein [Clostridia bacterium]